MEDKPIRVVEKGNDIQIYWTKTHYSWLGLSVDKGTGYIMNLRVFPQRKGLGRKTLEWIKENKAKRIIPIAIKGSAMIFWVKMLKEGLISEI